MQARLRPETACWLNCDEADSFSHALWCVLRLIRATAASSGGYQFGADGQIRYFQYGKVAVGSTDFDL